MHYRQLQCNQLHQRQHAQAVALKQFLLQQAVQAYHIPGEGMEQQ
jgi:hypothetical protein